MQVSSKLLSRTAIVLLGVLLAMVVFVAINNSQQAGAVSAGEQTILKSYVNSYIASQYVYGNEGEAGFVVDAATVKGRIDSDNTIGASGTSGVLAEGDDAASAPVLVDVLVSTGNVIPGSSARCLWNGTAATGCLETAQITTIRNRVNAHEAAGFSTDVIAYCATGHTEAPATGGLGFIAQTGGLGGSTTPKVYAFKWGRNGWQNTTKSYANANTKGNPTATSSYGASTPITACTGSTPDSELVRCAAAWAISATGGNVSNGVPTWATTSGQAIDIRNGNQTGKAIVNGTAGSNTVQVPVDVVFNTGLANLNPAASPKKLFVGRTQHLPGIVATGAEMIGYDSAFLQWGMPNYNNTLDEKWVSSGVVYPVVTATANNLTSGIDVTAPTVSSTTVPNVSSDQADIVNVANEAATAKVALTGSDGHVVNENRTVMWKYKVVHLSGLHPGVTYSGTVTAYDGQANGTTSTVPAFTTVAQDTTAPVVTVTPPSQTVEATGPTGATASYSASAVDAVYGSVAVSCDVASGSTFPIGTTTVTCTATDPPGNIGTGTATVTVVDTTAPALSLPADITVTIGDLGPATVSFTATASDLVDGSVPVTCTPASGSAFAVGTTPVNCSASDSSSNVANGSFNVTVISTCTVAKPNLSLNAPSAFWASMADYTAKKLSVTWTVKNNGTGIAKNVLITSSTPTYAPISSIPGWAGIGDIAAGGTGSTVIQYQMTTIGSGFRVVNVATAQDCSGASYTYP